MAEESPSNPPQIENVQPREQQHVGPEISSAPTPQPQNREELIGRARTFLTSPQIQGQDISAKRKFLVEKGLTEGEISGLLQGSAPRLPLIPPRTYPQPPPSNLPTLLLGLARLFSWIGIGSAALVFLYYRVLLPRIIQNAQARQALRVHHISLMTKLTESLSSYKDQQKEDFASLPKADPCRESPTFSRCKSVGQILKTFGETEPDFFSIPPVSLLRCAISDFSKRNTEGDPNPTAEEIFRVLEGRIPWLLTEEGYKLKKSLYETLLNCPLFIEEKPEKSEGTQEQPLVSTWKYAPPPPSTPSPLVQSIQSLSSAMPVPEKIRISPFQHVIQTLSEFTGYISSQVYIPYHPPPGGMGIVTSHSLSPAEEQLKREIRTLKGLVLNRKSFMPSIPRPGVFSPAPT
ncbi:hypothetical protein EST38_g3906 [Candolleomyces aberdarensis]|uniref:Peroxisomal membrane protein PEX14 n=1 Tax=Candolleomyces aberdarensis TaxID=2316362 RepID=A0A4Q2DNT4_9AGAR|nr:hypothetical protein EST38_g3906 [Candolleomyces aberdarensis]